MSDPVDVECWCAVNTAPHSTHEVVLDPFLIHALSNLTLKLLTIQAQLLSIAEGDARVAEGCLVFVGKVVHRPELSLSRGCLCRLSRVHSMLVNICQRKVAEHEP